MTHYRLPPLLVILASLVVLVPRPALAVERHEGVARRPDAGGVAYRESHWIERDGASVRRLVLYRCASGEPFARKTVHAGADATAPDFDFVDARSGYREGVRSRAGAREVYAQSSASAAPDSTRIALPAGTVIDAGFDAWVRARWPRLATGPGQVAPFLVPSRMRAYDVRVAAAGDSTEGGRPVRRLRMRLDAWFGFALPDTVLTYDVRDRRLLRFEGIGTVRDARGRPLPVRIDFPAAPVASTRAELDAASRQALVSRCPA